MGSQVNFFFNTLTVYVVLEPAPGLYYTTSGPPSRAVQRTSGQPGHGLRVAAAAREGAQTHTSSCRLHIACRAAPRWQVCGGGGVRGRGKEWRETDRGPTVREGVGQR